MKFNPDTVHKIFHEYREASHRLLELSKLSYPELVQDPHKIASAKYHFIVVIEAAIDLCNHLIAQNGLRVPEDYADTFLQTSPVRLNKWLVLETAWYTVIGI